MTQGALVSPTIDRTLLDNAFYVSEKTLTKEFLNLKNNSHKKQNKKKHTHTNLNG